MPIRPVLLFLFLSVCLTAAAQTSSPGLQLLGHLPYDTATLAGCWHYVDSSGTEYALVGTSKGMSIVDLSDPAHPYQRFKVPGLSNNWRELKVWAGFAYVGSEALNSGITIVDLRQLPDTIYYKVYTGDGPYTGQILKSHTVAATDGYLYVFGANNTITNGAIICSLADPWNPQVVGWYDDNYLHDGYIRNDTLYGSEIYAGGFSVVDVSDKTNPQLLATHPTPTAFNHNSWLSDNGRILFTTDEVQNAPLAAFDISDLQNITLLDLYLCSQLPSKEVHNVRVLNDFLINPSYGGQLTIVDAHQPDNLIETAWAVMGNSLVWDADPYLPSGIVFATAKNEGLFVYKPNYQRAAYLDGLVYDQFTGMPLPGAKVFVENTPNADTSNAEGMYKTGAALPGTYTVRAERSGYETKTIPGVQLNTAQSTTLAIYLWPTFIAAQQLGSVPPFNVTPTLFSDQITLHLPDWNEFRDGTTRVHILDMNGKTLLDEPIASEYTVLNAVESFPPGLYLLTLQNARKVSSPVRIMKG